MHFALSGRNLLLVLFAVLSVFLFFLKKCFYIFKEQLATHCFGYLGFRSRAAFPRIAFPRYSCFPVLGVRAKRPTPARAGVSRVLTYILT